MDYGQSRQNNQQPTAPQDFFTVGAGTNNPDVNSFESENNLDISSGEWGNPTGHDAQNIGKSALLGGHQTEKYGVAGEDAAPKSTPFEFMPGAPEPPITSPSQSINAQDDQEATINFSHLKTSEALSPLGVQEVVKAINQLNKDDKIADFYDTARQMMTANLKNSYGDKANWRIEE